MTYNAGDLGSVVGDGEQQIDRAMPSDEAEQFHTDIHELMMEFCTNLMGGRVPPPPVIQMTCTMVQASYLLGLKHGCGMVAEIDAELKRFNTAPLPPNHPEAM